MRTFWPRLRVSFPPGNSHLPSLFSTSRTELFNRYENGTKLSGVIYVHCISDNRLRGAPGRNFGMFREFCGDSALKNVVLTTTMWDLVPLPIGESLENKLSSMCFNEAIEKGAQIVRHYNTPQSAHDVIRTIVKHPPVVLQIQQEMVERGKAVNETEAGKAFERHAAGLENIRRQKVREERIREEKIRERKDEGVRR